MATVSPEGEPCATRPVGPDRRGLAIRGNRRSLVRAAVARADDPTVQDNLAGGGAIAVTGANVITLESFQLKGRAVDLGSPPPRATANGPNASATSSSPTSSCPTARTGRCSSTWCPPPSPRAPCTSRRCSMRLPDRAWARPSTPLDHERRPGSRPRAVRPAPVLRGRGAGGDRHRVGRRHAERDLLVAGPPGRRRAGGAVQPVLLQDRAELGLSASVLLIDPTTYDQFRLTLAYERTERRGPVFDQLRDDVDPALAALQGHAGRVQLGAADIYRVTHIDTLLVPASPGPVVETPTRAPDPMNLGELSARLTTASGKILHWWRLRPQSQEILYE